MSTKGRRRSDADFQREIDAHLTLETDRLIAEGLSPAAARLEARRQFGSVAAARERYFESRRWMWLDRLRQDLRDAARSVTRYPIASAVGILSIAAGLGVTAATLTIRNVIFRNPPPEYADPEQLSEIRVASGAAAIQPIGSYAPGGLVSAWITTLGASTIAAVQPPAGVRDVRISDRTEAVKVRGATAELFDVLGVRPIVGGTFTGASAVSTAEPAILSYRLWQQWFDARPDAVGSTMWIENRPYTIVGVLPRHFWVSEFHPAVWTRLNRTAIDAADRLEVFARRPRGTTPEALLSTLQPAMAAYASGLPADRRQMHMAVARVEGTPMARQMSIALPWLLGTASLLTLLIACANVAILLIARWTSREHEIAIRASLGASRGRLVRSLLTESTLVAVCGGVLGVGTGYALLTVLLMRNGAPDFLDVTIQPSVFVQSAIITLGAGILVGLAPALLETRRLHGNPMRVNSLTEPLRQRWRHALVVLEIAVTAALLVVASTLVNSYRRITNAEMGFNTRPLLSARAENPGGVSVDAALEAIRSVPGIADAAVSTTIPFTVRGPRARVALDAIGTNAVNSEQGSVTASFFSTLEVPMLAGRSFTGGDAAKARVAIVNEALARRLFGGTTASAVGGRIWFENAAYDIVGVAANFANGSFFVDYDPRVFLPLTADPKALTRAAFVVRAKDDPAPLVPAVRRAVRDSATGTTVTGTFTFESFKTVSGQELLVGTAPLLPLIVIGLLLTTAGIYGVLAFAIARQSRELAVRVAIGATDRHLIALVAGHSMRLVVLGSILGVGLTFALSRIARASGGAGSPFDGDWTAFAIPLAIISGVAAIATWAPTRRVRKIDPAVLLRAT